MDLTPKDLDVVRLVAASGSLTKAARQMHLTQPAISQRLSTVQDRIGARLFHRRGGRMQATPVAERLAAAAVDVDRILTRALADVDELLGRRRHQFRITTQCHTSYRWLSFVIRDLAEAHDNLAVDVVPEASNDPRGAVERGEVDAALVYTAETSESDIELFDDELFAVMPLDHPLAGRKYLNPRDFEDESLLLYTGKRHAFIDCVLAPAGVTPALVRQVRMTEALVELARAGQGIAVLAGWVLNDLPNRDDLAAVRITRRGYRRTWRIILADDCPPDIAETFVASTRNTTGAIAMRDWRTSLETS